MSFNNQPTEPLHPPKKRLTLSPRLLLIGTALIALIMGLLGAFIFFAMQPGTTPVKQPVGSTLGSGPWHTQGAQILDANNRPIRITGVNWFGFETDTFVVHGLQSRNYQDMLKQIKSLGYNTIRLPYSSQLFDASSKPTGIDYTKNPDLQGLQGLALMDKIINYASQLGLHVILDHHRPSASGQTALWYTAAYPESRWISDWQMLAKHYQNNPMVVGADLDNEPHAPACWGCGQPAIDWQQAAQRAGNAILSVNPNWLIFVEGVDCYGPGGSTQPGSASCSWWGGNLQGVKAAPVKLSSSDKLVYSVHDYPSSVGGHPWFQSADYPQNLTQVWDTNWGFIQKEGIAPVWVGEFGSRLQTSSDQQWFNALIGYLGQGVNGYNWTFWSWNPDSSDTGGILQDDWQTVNQQKQDQLRTIQFPLGGQAPAQQSASSQQTTPTAAPAVTGNALTLEEQSANQNATVNQLQIALKLTNTSNSPLDLKNITLRYWYMVDAPQQEVTVCDYATIDCGNVQERVVKMQPPRSGADEYLEISFSGGSLAANAFTEIKVRMHKSDWSNYNQSNDYSYLANATSYQSAPRVGIYNQGKLIGGQEPNG
ncbi:MAG: cellulase family glycosylhydrolase [Chloroflexota bacterium]|nr:cellulase family glycosylhydrolase [Chloroflexota bacterium]